MEKPKISRRDIPPPEAFLFASGLATSACDLAVETVAPTAKPGTPAASSAAATNPPKFQKYPNEFDTYRACRRSHKSSGGSQI